MRQTCGAGTGATAARHSLPVARVCRPAAGARSAGSIASARARPDSSPIAHAHAGRLTSHAPSSSVRTADADARVEHGVEDVGEQVEQHHEHRGDGHPRQDHRVVGSFERVEEQQAEAGPAEHPLDHDHPAEQHAGVDGDDGHERDQRVAQRVTPDDLTARHALRPRGAHVVGVQHLEHAVALVAAPRGHAREHEHQHRQHHVLDQVDDVALLADASTCPARRARRCRAARAARRPRTAAAAARRRSRASRTRSTRTTSAA